MKKIILFLTASIMLSNGFSQDSLKRQSIYKYRLGVDIPIGLITLGTGATSLILHKKKKPLTLGELSNLQATDVNKFDRYAIYQHSKPSAIASDVFQYTAMVSPALLFIDKDIRKDWNTVLPIWMETFAITSTLTMFTKELAKRNRPYVYSDYDNGNKYSKDARSSFWSGHTSITAASTYFIAMVYADYHPHSRWKPLMWTGAAILPALTGLTRVKAGKHYWTDVITGYAVGALVGTLTPFLHRREFRRK
ncbi:MAG: phosphatase PAP2 family protein [Chitinophagales bacterium]